MYILSIDTTAKTATVAVSKSDENKSVVLVCTMTVANTLTHSESILPMVHKSLEFSRLDIKDIDILAVSEGPGSFTGVRIGIATVKGLAFGNDKIKAVSVSALEALAHNVDDAPKNTLICCCMDARRNQFYNALFKSDGTGNIKRLCKDRAVSFDELKDELLQKYKSRKILLVGDGANLAYNLFLQGEYTDKLKINLARTDRQIQNAYSVAKVAVLRFDENKEYSAQTLSPMYLRQSQAERERNQRMSKV